MRVTTWNVAHRVPLNGDEPGAARYLRDLGTDIALLQEARPEDWPNSVRAQPAISEKRAWSSAVVSRRAPLNPVRAVKPRWGTGPTELYRTWPGSVAVASTHLSDGKPLTFVSLYGLMDNGWAYTTLHKQISDLTYLFYSPLGKRVVIGGDFNGGTQGGSIDALYANLWERLRLLGVVDLVDHTRESRPRLTSCGCNSDDCGHVQTVRLRNSTKTNQTDYLFVSTSLLPRVTGCHVHDDDRAWALSDHCPISVDLDL
jgi:endonuclease/exonuclease/phosphatase family metal-dependent hydrolase